MWLYARIICQRTGFCLAVIPQKRVHYIQQYKIQRNRRSCGSELWSHTYKCEDMQKLQVSRSLRNLSIYQITFGFLPVSLFAYF
jgi:hypothetical protein